MNVEPKDCKWSIWTFPSNLSHIVADYDNNNNVLFKYSLVNGNIYFFDSTSHTDFTNSIRAYGASYLIGADSEIVFHFDAVRIRARGSGNLIITLTGEDEVLSLSPAVMTNSALPGRPLYRKFNFDGERISIKLEVDSAGDWFNINRVIAFANEEFAERPA